MISINERTSPKNELGLLYLEKIDPSSSEENHNYGYAPSVARYKKYYKDLFTSELIETTDLEEKINRRNNALSFFFEKYIPLYFDSNNITIFSIVISQEHYPNISTFLRNFNDKLKRHNSKYLAYVWVRDYGQYYGGKHFHLLLATNKMDEFTIKKFLTSEVNLRQNTSYKFKVQILETRYGMLQYLKDKGVYAEANQKSYGRSQISKYHVN